jgi:hypothetical protein
MTDQVALIASNGAVNATALTHREFPASPVPPYFGRCVSLPQSARSGDLAMTIETDDRDVVRRVVRRIAVDVMKLNVFAEAADATSVVVDEEQFGAGLGRDRPTTTRGLDA